MTINASAPYKPVASILQPASNKIQTVLNYDKIQEAHVLTLSLTINGFLATSQFILCRRKMQVDRERWGNTKVNHLALTVLRCVCLCVCVWVCYMRVVRRALLFTLSLSLSPSLSPSLSLSMVGVLLWKAMPRQCTAHSHAISAGVI